MHLFSLIFSIYRTHHHTTHQEGANYVRYVNHITSGWKWTVRVLMRHIKRACRRLDTSHSVCFTRCSQALQCTGQRVQWSVKVTQTMQHAACRPTARPLYRGRCISHDIAIWNATIYWLARWAMTWSLVYAYSNVLMKNKHADIAQITSSNWLSASFGTENPM